MKWLDFYFSFLMTLVKSVDKIVIQFLGRKNVTQFYVVSPISGGVVKLLSSDVEQKWTENSLHKKCSCKGFSQQLQN